MLKRISNSISKSWAPLLLVVVLPLAGCAATDQWAQDELPIAPYGGSKLHPIKVVGGRATVEDCGQWDADATDSDYNLMMPNHGCAVQANIAAMAANPRDLVRTRKMSRAAAEQRVKAINGLSGSATAASPTSTITGTAAAAKP
jgi:type IV pilus biogenesis protein CpaD/CtpE